MRKILSFLLACTPWWVDAANIRMQPEQIARMGIVIQPIGEVSVACGDTVKKGQVLARLQGAAFLEAQREFVQARAQATLAVVILCGLFSSTVLNMLVLPALYLRFGALARVIDNTQAP